MFGGIVFGITPLAGTLSFDLHQGRSGKLPSFEWYDVLSFPRLRTR